MDRDFRFSFYDNCVPPSPVENAKRLEFYYVDNKADVFSDKSTRLASANIKSKYFSHVIPSSYTFHANIPTTSTVPNSCSTTLMESYGNTDRSLLSDPPVKSIPKRPAISRKRNSESSLLSYSSTSTSPTSYIRPTSSGTLLEPIGANVSLHDISSSNGTVNETSSSDSVLNAANMIRGNTSFSGFHNDEIRLIKRINRRNGRMVVITHNRRGNSVSKICKSKSPHLLQPGSRPVKPKRYFRRLFCALFSTLVFAATCTVLAYLLLPTLLRDESFLRAFKRQDDAFHELIRRIHLFITSFYNSPKDKPKLIDIYKYSNAPYDIAFDENNINVSDTRQALMGLFDGKRIRDNLRRISANVHVAGTAEQLRLIDTLKREYEEMGYDVESTVYSALLSYPNYDNPNTINVWSESSQAWEQVSDGLAQSLGENIVAAQQNDDARAPVWWNAYSPNSNVSAQIVYVNYGTREDYDALKKIGINMDGKIALARYGALFRGEKAFIAQQNGAVGLILYGDPYDFAPKNSAYDNQTFPDTFWLPATGAQRGTLLRVQGDPETPGYPSKSYIHRTQSEQNLRLNGVLPAIPVTSIGYRDSLKIFQQFDGIPTPWSNWHGSLNITYRLTGSAIFRLDVRSTTQHSTVKNFIACLRGREYTDEWVFLGNHADAWVKGAVDPGTGTATMLEMARVLMSYANSTGWRPRRTICFCQWDGEEFGLIGSTEWVEEHIRVVEKRVVAYINVDHINGNDTLNVKATPLLYRTLVDAASWVSHPHSREYSSRWFNSSLLDAWRFYTAKGPLPGDRTVPAIQPPAGGSDFQAFIGSAGVAVADLRLESAPLYSFMLYHTMYEIPWTVEQLIDPNFQACTAIGKMWLELGRNLADSLIVPLSVEDYGTVLVEAVKRLDSYLHHSRVDIALGLHFYREKLNWLRMAVREFHKNAIAFQLIVQEITSGVRFVSIRQLRMLNDRLRSVERCFVLDEHMKRPSDRHVIFSPAISAGEITQAGASSAAPLAAVLRPALLWVHAKDDSNEEEMSRQLAAVRQGFSHLQFAIESATLTLKLTGFHN